MDFPLPVKIDDALWSKILGCIFYFAERDEAINISLVHREGKLRAVVKEQTVGFSWMRETSTRNYDLETGEISPHYPPSAKVSPGWEHAGGIFSHNTMLPFWSGTTDRSELHRDGTYLCVGLINNTKSHKPYLVTVSIARHGVREILLDSGVVNESVTPGKMSEDFQEKIHKFCVSAVSKVPYSTRCSKEA